VYFLNFVFFFEKNEFGDFEPEFGENLQTQKKICVRRFFLIQKTPSARIFCYQKNFCTHIFFEFGDFLQTQVQNLQTHFFRKKKSKFKKYTHSEVEFGEFSKLKG
jgi:D-hexose-6-phosphate mutarotase